MRILGPAVALALAAALVSVPAQASVYLSAGYRQSAANLGWQSVWSKGISGGVSIDLGMYIRLGYTYEDGYQKYEGFEDPNSKTTPIDADGNPVQRRIASDVRTKSHSLDLQIILYPGVVVTPYLIGGMAMKASVSRTWDPDAERFLIVNSPAVPTPQGGLGLQIRISEATSFTLQYVMSQGQVWTPVPGDPDHPVVKKMTDGSGSIGLKYKI